MYLAMFVFTTSLLGSGTAEDAKGPSVTQEQCEQRVSELGPFIAAELRQYGLQEIHGFCIADDSQAI